MSGAELIRHIRSDWPAIPVVLASGYVELPGDIDPTTPRLSKPYRQADLASILSSLVDKRPVSNIVSINAGRRN